MLRPDFVALLLLTSACAPRLHSASFGPREVLDASEGGQVRVYSEARPRCSIEEVGVVTGSPAHGWQSGDRVLSALRARAADMDGDAIIGLTVEHSNTSSGVLVEGTGVVSGSPSVVWTGTVVRFTDRSCME